MPTISEQALRELTAARLLTILKEIQTKRPFTEIQVRTVQNVNIGKFDGEEVIDVKTEKGRLTITTPVFVEKEKANG